MSYTVDICDWYRRTEDIQPSYGHIPDVYIFEEHQRAFPLWGTYANRDNKPLTLITFDSHTDTNLNRIKFIRNEGVYIEVSRNNPEWRKFKNSHNIKRENFNSKDAFCITRKLRNDEQIKMAADCEYISKVIIFTRAEDEHCLKFNYELEDRNRYKYDFTYRYVNNNNKADLEVLNKVKDDFILDIDLDFFIKPFDYNSELGVEMRKLIKTAKLITIATEPECFNYCRIDNGFTNDMALNNLIKVILEERTVDKENGDIE